MTTQTYAVSEIELVYKNKCKASERPRIIHSHDAYDILIASWDENKLGFIEQAKVMLLNRASKVLGIYEVSTGGVTGTVIDPRLVFVAALKANACSIILAHNHPSGNLMPSMADEALTEKIREGGKFLDINMLDHLIVAENGFYSFADEMTYGL
jgi:DNA repair protein RadC